jgi:predicted Co/Zn/Cd cation transporter (cation efflux family)
MDRDKRLPALNGALGLIVLILVVQMWLLTASLESYLAGHREAASSGAVLSAILFAACGGLYLFVGRVDRKSRSNRGA